MKRILVLLLFIIALFQVKAQNNRYDALWKEVDVCIEKDLPESAAQKASQIYKLAQREQNVPQMLKAWLTLMGQHEMRNPDSWSNNVKELERWEMTETDAVKRSVVAMVLASSYIGKDIEKALHYINRVIENKTLLLKVDAAQFEPIVETRNTSLKYWHNNLFDLLANESIEMLKSRQWQKPELKDEVKKIKQYVMNAYAEDDAAWLMTRLRWGEYTEAELWEWKERFVAMGECAEVYAALAERLGQTSTPKKEIVALLDEGIARYARYERINILKDKRQELATPYLTAYWDSMIAGNDTNIEIRYANLNSCTLKVYYLDADGTINYEKQDLKEITDEGKLVLSKSIVLPNALDYEQHVVNDVCNLRETGQYAFVFGTDEMKYKPTVSLTNLSGLKILHRQLPGELGMEILVVDRKTGKAMPYAQVCVRKNENREEVYATDEQGRVVLHLKGNITLRAVTDQDKSMVWQNLWSFSNGWSETTTHRLKEHVNLWTDRAIYRPGDSVHFAGWTFIQQGEEINALEGKTLNLKLLDANRKELALLSVTTNTLGSFEGTFVLPSSALLGNFCIETENASVYFKVEEFKLPTFEVNMQKPENAYKAGDVLVIRGKVTTYAGTYVQHAKVHYKIDKQNRWRWWQRGVSEHMATGECVTDTQGGFEVPVTLKNEDADQWFYDYVVQVDVTSVTGETRQSKIVLPVGSSAVKLNIELNQEAIIVKERVKAVTFSTVNLINQPVEAMVKYALIRCDGEKRSVVKEGNVNSNVAVLRKELSELPSGSYLLKAEVCQGTDERTTAEQSFSIFSEKDKQLPVDDMCWSICTAQEWKEGEVPQVFLGSKAQDITLFYDVWSGNKKVEGRVIRFSDAMLRFDFPYKETYGDGISVHFAFVKNGKLHSACYVIEKEKPDKRLLLTWESFRNKILPGTQEEWTLKVRKPDGTPADAELMSVLYDASADALTPHEWSFFIPFERNISSYPWEGGREMGQHYASLRFGRKDFPVKPLSYSRLVLPLLFKYGAIENVKLFSMATPMVTSRMVKNRSHAIEQDDVMAESNDIALNSIRTNFAQTAFFFPQLHTDKDGLVRISFQVPESLTRWKFMALAHSKDMCNGQLADYAEAKKEFMVQPFVPRFIRVGDKWVLKGLIQNCSELMQQGSVKLELKDAESNRLLVEKVQTFSMEAGQSKEVSFAIDSEIDSSLLIGKLVAWNKDYSDGEQFYLPVLSDEQVVNEAVSFFEKEAGRSVIYLDSLSITETQGSKVKRMLECGGNTLWHAIQSLPSLVEPKGKQVFSWVTSYYSLMLTRYLLQQYPELERQMRIQVEEGKSFRSSLQNNEEWKNVLLEETPWVDDADNERQKMAAWRTMLDEATVLERIEKASESIGRMQLHDGSWPWFEGMAGSRCVTTEVMVQLARIRKMTTGKLNKPIETLYEKGLRYLEKEAIKEYEWMTKQNNKLLPSEETLWYLYLRMMDGTLVQKSKINSFFVNRMKKSSSQLTILGKAHLALIMQAYGNKKVAKEMVQSIKEYAMMSRTEGRFFDTWKAKYSWRSYRIPTQIASMEALDLVEGNAAFVDDMKQWLLKQKRVQMWEDDLTTVDAIYALLNLGNNRQIEKGGKVDCYVDGIKLEVDENSYGYLKCDVTDAHEIVIEKKDDTPLWGAIYQQSLVKTENIKEKHNGLEIKRELWREGKQLTSDSVLKIGDKVEIRLCIKADADMDFIEMKDEFAACVEPISSLSGYEWNGELGFYKIVRDASIQFFFDKMRKGEHIIKYEAYVTRKGTYQMGISAIQSCYSPEYSAHSAAMSLTIE